jgi:O-succinylbenzoic acid--CoA ligase
VLTTEAALLLQQWQSGQAAFTVSSSGTTGVPKPFILKRNLIELSCRLTANALGIGAQDRIYCCLPLDKVGGMMQLFRAMVWNIPIDVVQASANPLLHYTGDASIVSLTPMQLGLVLQNHESKAALKRFRLVLLGGAGLSAELEAELQHWENPLFYHTYGMTETYSHIALRQAGKQTAFRFILPTETDTDASGRFRFRNELTENQWLQTNDCANILPDGRFIITGRADNIINSGGIKIQPEAVEAMIAIHSGLKENTFFCAGLPDSVLGEKLVLVLPEGTNPPDLAAIPFANAYLRPKEIVFRKTFLFTETNKLKRRETLLLSGT